MILSVGLSPAWQKTLVFQQFEVGAVNRAEQVYWTASGKVGNAAVAVRALEDGETSHRALMPIGGPAREAFDVDFETLGVQWRPVEVQCPTRVCTTIVDQATRSMTELVENAGPMSDEELDRFAAAYEEEAAQAEVVILTGSLPEGVSSDYYRQLLKRSICPAVLDFRGQGLLDVLAADLKDTPMILKPNRQELAQTVGRTLGTEGDLLAAMRELVDRGAEAVVVTDGSGPVRCLWGTDAFCAFPPEEVEVVSPLGCGDSLAAGLAWGIFNKWPPRQSVQLGVAAAVENLGTLLPGHFEGAKVFARVDEIRIEPM